MTSLFLDTVETDYQALTTDLPDHSITSELQSFLCESGRIDINGQTCGAKQFSLDDRLFRTISEYYYNGSSYGYGYEAFMEMSAAQEVVSIFNDGFLSSALLEEKDDVSVLQFQGSLDSNGTLSFSERYGNLTVGYGASSDRYGPELIFGQYLGNDTAEDVVLFKVVQGGTDLRVDWKTTCSIANTANDFTDEELAQDSLYDALLEKALAFQEDPTAYFPQYSGQSIEIAGFVWFQGWNDGGCTLCEENYETNLSCLISQLRSDLSLEELPTVVIQSHRGDGDSAVQVAQYNVAANTSNVELAVTEDLSPYYHFDNAAQLGIGARAYSAMAPMVEEVTMQGYEQADIGDVQVAGSVSVENGVYQVSVSSGDIYRFTDSFHFVYWPLNGALSENALECSLL